MIEREIPTATHARELALQECAEICAFIAGYYETAAEGKEEPGLSQALAKEAAARSCREAINRKLLAHVLEADVVQKGDPRNSLEKIKEKILEIPTRTELLGGRLINMCASKKCLIS